MVMLPPTMNRIGHALAVPGPSSLQCTMPRMVRLPSLTAKTPFTAPSWSSVEPSSEENATFPLTVTSSACAGDARAATHMRVTKMTVRVRMGCLLLDRLTHTSAKTAEKGPRRVAGCGLRVQGASSPSHCSPRDPQPATHNAPRSALRDEGSQIASVATQAQSLD